MDLIEKEEVIVKPVVEVSKFDFNKVKATAVFDEIVKDNADKVQNEFFRIKVEKGIIIEKDDNTSEVIKKVVYDNALCDPKEIEKLLKLLDKYGV